MKSVKQGSKKWLGVLAAGIILFAGGGGTGYMLGQQQAKSAQATQMKKASAGMGGRPSGKPSGAPGQSSSSSN
ncbi:hypothetical protein FC99_GL000676 [Levilactobacillus koreensis JCM 16448]|uniref:Uncharacterized protein n=1 Tax=Levilactobacillus koreensis TaxID=637971 RepID=A0AAC9ER57_9LACO|nr:hypothetical protein [Levilactobacillus koreensis]AKP64047.1 hypothetical protein ABN16_02905 [Levilactobacillus koreensis]KRK88185.1 hypothetical protein FC99_GL000676 [Levilactobacillus koreensis JCM 16448]